MSDKVLRAALWCAVPVNLFEAALFGGLATGESVALLPIVPQPFYATQLALVLALFAGSYAWLALQDAINRPLLVLGTLAKLGFCGLFILHGVSGDLPVPHLLGTIPDLMLGLVMAWRLLPRPAPAPRGRFPEGPANRFMVPTLREQSARRRGDPQRGGE